MQQEQLLLHLHEYAGKEQNTTVPTATPALLLPNNSKSSAWLRRARRRQTATHGACPRFPRSSGGCCSSTSPVQSSRSLLKCPLTGNSQSPFILRCEDLDRLLSNARSSYTCDAYHSSLSNLQQQQQQTAYRSTFRTLDQVQVCLILEFRQPVGAVRQLTSTVQSHSMLRQSRLQQPNCQG